MKYILNKEYVEKKINKIEGNEDLIYLIDEGYEIENFIGFVEIPEAMLEEEVPGNFKESQTPEFTHESYKETLIDDFGNELEVLKFKDAETGNMRQKTWSEYVCAEFGNTIKSKTPGNVLIRVGYRIGNGIGHTTNNEELLDWINYFGVGCLIEIDAVKDFKLTAETIDNINGREAVKAWIRQDGLAEHFNLTKSEEDLKTELKKHFGLIEV